MEGLELHPANENERLAYEIAGLLGDPEGIGYYLTVVRRYPQAHLRKVLEHVLAIPEDRLKKSRGALFNWMLTRYGSPKDIKES